MGKNYIKKKKISLLSQQVALKATYKESECSIDKTKLAWMGKVRPTPLSKEYTVLLTYEMGYSPQVWVIGDELEKLDDINFPHNYEVDADNKMVRICLYRFSEFNQYKSLAKTIIPWTVEWLYYYELWVATGEWLGGGQHPNVGEKKEEEIVD